MAYRIFLSHSMEDLPFVEGVVSRAKQLGIEVIAAGLDRQPGRDIVAKVEEGIRGAQAVVALLTQRGRQSAFVQQEIGWARRDGKLIVPAVWPDVSQSSLAMLQGVELIHFDPEKPADSLNEVMAVLTGKKRERDDGNQVLGIFILVLLFVAALK